MYFILDAEIILKGKHDFYFGDLSGVMARAFNANTECKGRRSLRVQAQPGLHSK